MYEGSNNPAKNKQFTYCLGHQASQWHEQSSDEARESISNEAPLILHIASRPHSSHSYPFLQNPTGYPRRDRFFPLLNNVSPTGLSYKTLTFCSFYPLWFVFSKGVVSFFFFFFQSCRECLGITEQFAQGTQRLKTKLHTCRLVSG